MLPFEVLVFICIFCGIFSFIFLLITLRHIIKGNEKKAARSNAVITFLGIMLTVVTSLNVKIPSPTILPLDNDTKRYTDDLEITVTTENVSSAVDTYYTLDGSEPKYGSQYKNPIYISESTTVSARNKFLWWWSDISKSGYTFEEMTIDKLLALSKERPSYSLEDINNGILGDKITFNSIIISDSDYEWYQQAFHGNSIPDDTVVNEFDFVNARKYEVKYNDTYIWDNEITVEDGKLYIVRMYVHNNHPSAVAKDTRVWFDIPSKSDKQLQISGYIESSNATPVLYHDSVNFYSDTPFHLEYDYNSATLENGGIGIADGLKLNNDIIQSTNAFEGENNSGVLIGYNQLDGRIPGNYEHINYISMVVKVCFDYDFVTETKVRLADGEDKTWKDSVEATIGDRVQFHIQYRNASDQWQNGVVIRSVLPNNLQYVIGSTRLMNACHPDGDKINEDFLVTTGIGIGNYSPNANAYVMFTAEVIDKDLADGGNRLINWGQASVGSKTNQDYASVFVQKLASPEE